ncbi:hypothetical protein Daura_12720 [Dactylosporangium aurantiacum]|uniref:Uncharacterized protein n=1 Tax=Dactylosporangium aurantiacum TaxID=35754 RepID=A0A9Q9MJI6_9ACTN|nr:hypothetical protein [Dactylosporangium aurantiacum]MDG6105729.1 hypothetical protein [Dactylosporangium aurantiacum]UWZ56950.1 hypothetical protein Daura_12720 [Dactylosporangium aurantiacum]
MKKVFLILGIIAGSLLLLCCGGGVALYFLADSTTYAKPADACATVTAAKGTSAFGALKDQQKKDTTAFGRTYGGCVLTYEATGTLTVAIDVPSSASDVRTHYDAVKKLAEASTAAGATVTDVDGIGTKAFAMYTTAGGALMYELDLYDGNLYLSLNLTAPAGTTLTPDKVRADFLVIGKSMMTSLESSSSGDRDD